MPSTPASPLPPPKTPAPAEYEVAIPFGYDRLYEPGEKVKEGEMPARVIEDLLKDQWLIAIE